MTYAEKKVLYGAVNRIAVGGKPDEVANDQKKGAMYAWYMMEHDD